MTLTYVGGTSATGTAATYTVSLTALTGGIASQPAQNDIVIVMSGFGNTASVAPTISGNNSGAYLGAHAALYQNDTWDINFRTFYQIMGATPDTSLTAGRTNNAAYGGATVVHVWRGVNTTTPFDVTTVTAGSINSYRIDPPAITPVTAGAVILCGGAGTQGTSGTALGIFSGMANGVSITADGTTSDTAALIASLAWTSGTFDPPSPTSDTSPSSSWASVSLALRPAVPTPSGGLMKVWNGTTWVEKPVKVWNGSAWVQKPVKYWNGTAWVLS